MARALAADPPVLLMDEPFGAVDPIVRARLQRELLELQAKVQRTIVLVTHDIDEAVALGDKVAVLNVGGVLEQYAAPDELLAAPANAFVASFLGAERGIKRLSLATVGGLDLDGGAWTDVAAGADAARAVLAATGSEWLGLVDRRPLRRVGHRRRGDRRGLARRTSRRCPPAAGCGPRARCARRSR